MTDDPRQSQRYRNRPERTELMKRLGMDPKDPVDHTRLYRILRAIGDVVRANGKSVFPGLGTFEWKKFSGVLPTGKSFKSHRLIFKLTRSDRRRKPE